MLCYYYDAFGLRIRSTFQLPEVRSSTQSAFDVEIVEGAVPRDIPHAVDSGIRFHATSDQLLVIVDRIARYHVVAGAKIIVERYAGAEEDAIRLFLLGPVFSGLLLQRGDLVLSGSAIEAGDRAIVFLGVAGVGKSTVALALQQRGYRLLADEHCAIRAGSDETGFVQAGYLRTKMWPDSLKKLGQTPEVWPCVRRGIEKRSVLVGDASAGEPLPIGKIYMLFSKPTESVSLLSLDDSKAYATIVNPINRNPFLRGLQLEERQQQSLLSLVTKVPVIAVHRPKHKFALTEMTDVLEADFRK